MKHKLIPNKPPTRLTETQRWLVNRLIQRAIVRRGRLPRNRWKLRRAGIVSAVVRGTVGNSRWGRSMLARRGGQTLARDAPDHMRRISRVAVRAKQFRRMCREEQIAFAVAEVERIRRQGANSAYS